MARYSRLVYDSLPPLYRFPGNTWNPQRRRRARCSMRTVRQQIIISTKKKKKEGRKEADGLCVCVCATGDLWASPARRLVVPTDKWTPTLYSGLLLLAHKKRERENNSNSLSLFESYQPLSLYFVQFSSHYIENRELSVHCTVSLFADVELVAEKGQEIKEMRREQRDSRPTPVRLPSDSIYIEL